MTTDDFCYAIILVLTALREGLILICLGLGAAVLSKLVMS